MWDFNYGTGRNSAPLCEYYHNGIYEGKVYPALKGQAPPQNLYVHAADDAYWRRNAARDVAWRFCAN